MATKSAPAQRPAPPLRAVRDARGKGLREVAREAGIDPSVLSRIERGQQGISLDLLYRLARVLGLRELEKMLKPYVRGNGRG